ncbi:MAG: hypothetical protein KHX13_04775 [Acidaminococcus intestini]|uniref:Uncharacterized protein n=1 Tax=Acidaminococcus intestini TaxID=187327 RepID=A0A943EJU2_9FIRM|nr:hypothetical protein [Acidaminococcus intestini]
MSIEDYEKTASINFRVPRAYREALKERASDLGINVSLFFRKAMEDLLNESDTFVMPIKSKPRQDMAIISFYVDEESKTDFLNFCHHYHYASSEVMRAFIDLVPHCFTKGDSMELKTSLLYLVIFLQNAMKAYGLTMDNLESIEATPAPSSDLPLIQEERQGTSRLFKIYDKKTSTIFTAIFNPVATRNEGP